MSPKRPQTVAQRVLRKHSVVAPAIPVEEIAENEGVRVVYHDLEDDTSALLIRQDDTAVIVVNVRHHEHRQRFSIAHELGHYLLHKSEPTVFVDDLLLHFRSEKTSRNFDPREAEANQFAACLLMPARFLREDLKDGPIDAGDDEGFGNLARRYKVSPQALAIRLERLGHVP